MTLADLVFFALETPGGGAGPDENVRNAIASGVLLLLSLAPALALMAFFPARSARVRAALVARPIVGTLLGAANLVILIVLITVFSQGDQTAQVIALLIAVAAALMGLQSFLAVSRELGERLLAPGVSALKAVSFGWLILSLTAFLPVVGAILLVLPLSAGLGAVVLSLRGPRASAPGRDAPDSRPAA